MSDDNPFRSPQAQPEPNLGNRLLFAPRTVFWMAAILSVFLGISVIGGIVVAIEKAAILLPAVISFIYAVGSWWCGRLALRIYRNELRAN